MINEALQGIFGWRIGHLLNEGFQVKCAGTQGEDANGSPVVSDRHVICELDDHLPNTQAHAFGNPEFDDSLWVIDPSQTSINWTAPVCQVCGKPLAP